MEATKKEINSKNQIILTCEKSFLFGLIKKEIKYLATNRITIDFWDWVKLPNKTIVADSLSFQLDSWCRNFD